MRYEALVLAIIIVGAVFLVAPMTMAGGQNQQKAVGAILYLWYGYNYQTGSWTGGLGTSHWNDSAYDVVVDTPVIGYYASDSPSTFAWQINQMVSDGITFVLVDWWGPGATNQLDAAVNQATLALLQWIQQTGSPMKVAIMVDQFNSTPMGAQDYAQIQSYVETEFYGPYASEIFHWEGQPLLVWWGSFSPPAAAGLTQRTLGYNDQWAWEDLPVQFFQGGKIPYWVSSSSPISADGEITISPRYDDYYLYAAGSRQSYAEYDVTYGLGMYRYLWRYIMASPQVHLVIIYSWNEYHERTEIEPHTDYTARGMNPYMLSNETESFIRSWE
ncbi:MAG: hypothetical protein JRN22_00815 [Nitrososphaerota archaeon]|nr:hypothetical protein [Nitrososphaerota archaeon]